MTDLARHVLDAYDDAPGYRVALGDLLPRREPSALPALLVVGVLSAGCVQRMEPAVLAAAPMPALLTVLTPEHEHDAAIGKALYTCVHHQTNNPRLFHSFDMVWREIQVGRDFAGVTGAACVPSAALIACQEGETWEGVDKYFQAHKAETCTTVADIVDRTRAAERGR